MNEDQVRERMENAMHKIEDFYFGEEENTGEQLFNNFAEKHAAQFAGFTKNVHAEEHKLEHTIAYQEFQTIFESKLDEIVTSCGLSVPVFFEQLKKDAQTDEDCAVFVQIILSISDFESFAEMMAAYVKEHKIE